MMSIVGISFLLAVPIAASWYVGIRIVAARRMRERRTTHRWAPEPPPLRTDAPPLHLETAVPSAGPRHPDARALYARARRSRMYAAALYLLAGLMAACVLAWCELLSGEHFDVAERLGLVLNHSWPAALTVIAVALPSFRRKLLAYAVAATVIFLGMWAVEDMQSWLEAAWAPTLLLLLVMNRWLKTIAPLLVIPTLAVIFAVVVAVGGVMEDSWLGATVLAPIVLACAAIVLVAIVRGYERKRFSDLSFQLGFLWAVFSFWYMADELVDVWWAAFAAIGAYGLTTFLAVPVLRRAALQHRPASLLVLRVFGAPSRTHRLFEEVGTRWRTIGPIHLIAGTDSIVINLDISELAHMVTMRSRTLYVSDKANLERRLAGLDTAPDPDGRYRTNDFFCFDDTWKPTFTQLLVRSDAVLVDLSGYGPQNAGVAFELAHLLARRPLDSFVLMTDDTTNANYLSATLTRLWRELDPSLPNARIQRPVLRVLHNPHPRNLVAALCDAAVAGGWRDERHPVAQRQPAPA